MFDGTKINMIKSKMYKKTAVLPSVTEDFRLGPSTTALWTSSCSVLVLKNIDVCVCAGRLTSILSTVVCNKYK